MRNRKMKSKKFRINAKGITLIALVITIIVLLILAGVTIATLFGDNGIITKALEAKQKTEEAAEKEQQLLAGAFERNYVTYNGQLHVEGTKLMNEHNEEVRLKGGNFLNSSDDNEYSKELISNFKNNWGANVIKVGLNNSSSSTPYTDQQQMEKMYSIIDTAIDLDMYVIVIFWSGNDLTTNIQEEAIEYFSQIASKYKNIPNILYEIANEPLQSWEEISTYAYNVIPVIRNISPDCIVICPSRGQEYLPEVIEDRLSIENIMYAVHCYAGNTDVCRHINEAIWNNIPIFVTEWSVGSGDEKNIDIEATDRFISIMDKYNISSTFFILCKYGRESTLQMIQDGKWDSSLSDDILTETGKYIKGFMTEDYIPYDAFSIKDYTLDTRANKDAGLAFWDQKYRSDITEIVTLNYVKDIPKNIVRAWDVSPNGSGKIMAYLVNDENIDNKYVAYLVSEDEYIYIGSDHWRLFNTFEELQSINLECLNTQYATTMQEWFSYCTNLRTITGLDKLETYNVINMQQMFQQCYELTNLDFKSFDTSNVTNMSYMFHNCYKLMELNLNQFNTDKVTTTKNMFANCGNLKTIHLENANFNSVTDTGAMFYDVSDEITIYVKNEDVKVFLENCLKDVYKTGSVIVAESN